jgi:hypothetical protein
MLLHVWLQLSHINTCPVMQAKSPQNIFCSNSPRLCIFVSTVEYSTCEDKDGGKRYLRQGQMNQVDKH